MTDSSGQEENFDALDAPVKPPADSGNASSPEEYLVELKAAVLIGLGMLVGLVAIPLSFIDLGKAELPWLAPAVRFVALLCVVAIVAGISLLVRRPRAGRGGP